MPTPEAARLVHSARAQGPGARTAGFIEVGIRGEPEHGRADDQHADQIARQHQRHCGRVQGFVQGCGHGSTRRHCSEVGFKVGGHCGTGAAAAHTRVPRSRCPAGSAPRSWERPQGEQELAAGAVRPLLCFSAARDANGARAHAASSRAVERLALFRARRPFGGGAPALPVQLDRTSTAFAVPARQPVQPLPGGGRTFRAPGRRRGFHVARAGQRPDRVRAQRRAAHAAVQRDKRPRGRPRHQRARGLLLRLRAAAQSTPTASLRPASKACGPVSTDTCLMIVMQAPPTVSLHAETGALAGQ